jgi:hypothetical protein
MAEVFRGDLALPIEDRAETEPPISHVKITNHNSFPLRDMFDSRVYEFPPGKGVTLDMATATHIFGFNLDSPEKALPHCMRRFGWNVPEHSVEARNYYNKLEFKPVRFVLVEQAPEPRRGPGRPRTKDETPTGSASA